MARKPPLLHDSTAKADKPDDVPAAIWDFMTDEQKARYAALSDSALAARPALQAIGGIRGEMGAVALERALAELVESLPGEPGDGEPAESYADEPHDSPISAMTETVGQELDRQREDNAAIIASCAAERSHMLWQVQYEMAKRQREDDRRQDRRQRKRDLARLERQRAEDLALVRRNLWIAGIGVVVAILVALFGKS